MTPADIHVNGDKAVAESVGNIQLRFQEAGHDYDLISYTRFIHRLVKVDSSEWKIVGFGCIYIKDSILPAAPTGAAFSPDVSEYRESYKYLSWLLSRTGYSIRPTLPGIDQPEEAGRLMDEHFTWLRS